MKKSLINRISGIKVGVLIGLIGLLSIKTSTAEVLQTRISFQVFYDELLPYGDWINDPVHGYVWVPYAEPNFQPYATNGYWVMSTYGNTWVSNYEWGWAPFHYGRWYFDDYLGWAWVPGYEWGPAWVNWRTGGGYYGWAPLMPGISIQVAINIPSHHWIFVPRRRLISRNIYNYYISRKNVYRIYNQTTVINNTYVYNNRTYRSGPERREIERVTRRSVPVYQVNNSSRPGRSAVSRNSLQVYRPEIRQVINNSRSTQARPSRVVTANEHKVNMVNRKNSRSTANSTQARTAPANSRTNNRATETVRNNNSTRRRVEATAGNSSRTNMNNPRIQSPANSNQRATPNRPGNATRQATEQSRVNANQNRKVQSPVHQRPTDVRQQRSTGRQVRSESQASRGNRSVQPGRSSNQVRTAPAQKSRSTPRVSSSSTRERNSGNASRSNTQNRRSTRGNN
ncbi:MAG: DUF6600 domain-containing protein [Anditalea sp.]